MPTTHFDGIKKQQKDVFAQSDDLTLAFPACEFGIGDLIHTATSPKLIDGVRIHPLTLWPDDRGYFMELHRMGQDLVSDFSAHGQVSTALSYPGTIKAFHYHLEQRDCWSPVLGMFQVALVDLRVDSCTFGQRNTIYSGHLKPLQILIPRGVGHGYKIVGVETALLVYFTDKQYNPQDEGRISYDHPAINYNWQAQHK